MASIFAWTPTLAQRPLDLDPDAAEALRAQVVFRLGSRAPRPLYSQPRQVVSTPRFLYVVDNALTLPAAPWNEQGYAEAFALAKGAFEEIEGRQKKALLVFSTFDEGGTALFYTPLANDVSGLGVGRATEIFDDTPDSELDGLIWMGPVDELLAAGDAYFEEAFVHEIAHRWVAYAELDHGLLPPGILRGRQSTHWSFLLDTRTSPMEGNGWVDAGDRRYRTGPRVGAPLFSPLDLYFMGVATPEEVPPFRLITSFTQVAPNWLAVRPDTTPAHRLGVEVSLEATTDVMVDIDAIIASNGPRAPSAEPRLSWPIGVVLISNGIQKASRADLERLDRMLEHLTETFKVATYDRIELDLTIATAGTKPLGALCDAVAECDRTRSELCAAPPRGAAICTRPCETSDECGPEHCCSPSASLCALDCSGDPSTPSQTDGGASQPVTTPIDGLESAGAGCNCRSTSSSTTLWGLALALAIGVRRRRSD